MMIAILMMLLLMVTLDITRAGDEAEVDLRILLSIARTTHSARPGLSNMEIGHRRKHSLWRCSFPAALSLDVWEL